MTDLRDVRREYTGEPLSKNSLHADPIDQFDEWLEIAGEYHPEDSTAMVLATASSCGQPKVRTVLLKHFDQQGFCWYSNSASAKGLDLEQNSKAALQFYWYKLNRQLRIEGSVEKLPRSDAESYFNSRPIGAKISAYVSRQSQVVANRSTLEALASEAADQYSGGHVPCPEDWCGYRLKPEVMEFWQGRENRLHDRLQYSRLSEGWRIVRLAP